MLEAQLQQLQEFQQLPDAHALPASSPATNRSRSEKVQRNRNGDDDRPKQQMRADFGQLRPKADTNRQIAEYAANRPPIQQPLQQSFQPQQQMQVDYVPLQPRADSNRRIAEAAAQPPYAIPQQAPVPVRQNSAPSAPIPTIPMNFPPPMLAQQPAAYPPNLISNGQFNADIMNSVRMRSLWLRVIAHSLRLCARRCCRIRSPCFPRVRATRS